MKKLYPYNKFITEGVRDQMTPKPMEDVLKNLRQLTVDKQLELSRRLNIPEIEELVKKNIKLIDASKSGRASVVEEMINGGAQIDVRNEEKLSALHLASRNGHLDVVKLLVENGANINIERGIGMTPLYHATLGGNLDVVKYLFEKGAELNVRNENGWTPMLCACNNGNLDIVQFLVENGIDVNDKDDSDTSALMWASYKGRLDVVKYLVSKGAIVYSLKMYDNTPLAYAAKGRHFDVLKFLIDHMTKTNESVRNMMTPKSSDYITDELEKISDERKMVMLLDAIRKEDLEMMLVLLNNGVRITPLMIRTASELHRLSALSLLKYIKEKRTKNK